MTNQEYTLRKIDSLTYMRGIAVLMVILVHTSQQIEGEFLLRNFSLYGMMGVQMFFVASAFTLCYSMDTRREKNFRNYVLRRFFRIAPTYYIGILLYYLVNIVTVYFNIENKTGYDYSLTNVLANVFLIHGLYAPANNNIVPGGWSIGAEIIFYLIVPFIFVGIYNLYTKSKLMLFLAPLASLFIAIVFQLLTSNLVNLYSEDKMFFYYNILNQLPVFFVGISLFFAFKLGYLDKFKKSFTLIGLIFFTLCSLALLAYGLNRNPIFDSLIPFFSGISFGFLFIYLQFYVKKDLNLLNKVGLYSFSSYIIHFLFAVYLSSYLASKLSFIPGSILLIILFLITSFCTFFTAKIMYHVIELRFARIGKNIIKKLPVKKEVF